MTDELHRALARYEAARVGYRLAILGSFGGPHRGEAIRAAIAECRAARVAVEVVKGHDPTRALGGGLAR